MKRTLLIIFVVVGMLALVSKSCNRVPKESMPTPEVVSEPTVDSVAVLCLADTSRNPIAVLERLMSQPDCPMHGPEHHVLVGAALLTAYNNCLPDSAKLDLEAALAEMRERGEQVPGGACGYMGACGASISTGIFLSIVTRNTPLSTDTWRLCNLMTARALEQVAENGGPRCCKRDSYLSVLTAIDFVKENLGVEMEYPVGEPNTDELKTDAVRMPEVTCSRSQNNEQCIGEKCPFAPKP